MRSYMLALRVDDNIKKTFPLEKKDEKRVTYFPCFSANESVY